jgi:hypothetical protein
LNKRWENQRIWICGFASNSIAPIKLRPNKELKEEVNKVEVKYKYKFRLNYSLTESKTTYISESPEFRLTED